MAYSFVKILRCTKRVLLHHWECATSQLLTLMSIFFIFNVQDKIQNPTIPSFDRRNYTYKVSDRIFPVQELLCPFLFRAIDRFLFQVGMEHFFNLKLFLLLFQNISQFFFKNPLCLRKALVMPLHVSNGPASFCILSSFLKI